MKWRADWHPTETGRALMSVDLENETRVGELIAGILTTGKGGRVIIEAPNRTRVIIAPIGETVSFDDFVAGHVPQRKV